MTQRDASLVEPGDGRYVIEEQVAAGGMGVIYRVLDRSLGRTVAMKVCSRRGPTESEAAAPDPTRSRFLEEARVTARLDHPGIVPVHELGVSPDRQPYFTMPLVKGRSLGAIFQLARASQEGWNTSRAVAALVKVCQAVAYAHSKGVIHRDLKPANVMVGRFGEVYVLDWGLAKLIGKQEARGAGSDGDGIRATSSIEETTDAATTGRIGPSSSLLTEDGTVLGTPAYMPPEQAAGRGDLLDERSDVYALGAMLHELLTGHAPYLAPGARVTPRLLVESIVAGPPPPLRGLAGVPPELAAIGDKAMAREPAARYASALELAEDLQAHLDRRVVTAYRTGALAEILSWCSRHRTLLRAGAAVAVVLTAALVALNWGLKLREARQLAARAGRELERYNALRSEIPALRKAWLDARMSLPSSAPSWLRGDEIEKHRKLESALRELDASFDGAAFDLEGVVSVAPPGGVRSEARGQLQALYEHRCRELAAGETQLQSPEYYRQKLAELDPAALRALDRPGRISIQTEPPGAEVFCFRHEEGEDTRLVPLPFDAASHQVMGGSVLRIATILDAEQHQRLFAVGDELLDVRGKPVRSEAELARALEGMKVDEPAPVRLTRRGSSLESTWVPFPASSRSRLPAGSLLAIHEQLGLVFEGYPLQFLERCRLGETAAGRPVDAELPAGSYLLVLRKLGWRETRFPVAIPWRDRIETVRLLAEEEIPPGFVHVPAGPFTYGGDRFAFQSQERGEADLHGFFIARFETTIAEYLELLNDPAVSERLGADGSVTGPLSDAVREEELPRDPDGRRRLVLVSADSQGAPFFERDASGAWTIGARHARRLFPSSPVQAISQLAAREYARWRSQRDGKWIYRLPDDLEWEKAARGVDRRAHVWGEYLIGSFCWSGQGLRVAHVPPAVGLISSDESVYGVRDLGGSVEEHTSSRVLGSYTTRRGGTWSVFDSQSLRVASRNGRVAGGRGTETGFRLVAELK